jgi:hypothetical protein
MELLRSTLRNGCRGVLHEAAQIVPVHNMGIFIESQICFHFRKYLKPETAFMIEECKRRILEEINGSPAFPTSGDLKLSFCNGK